MPTSVAYSKRVQVSIAAVLCTGLILTAMWVAGGRGRGSTETAPSGPQVSRLTQPRSDPDFHTRQLVPPPDAVPTLAGSEAVARATAEFPGVIQNKVPGSTAAVELSLYFDDVVGGGEGKVPLYQNVLAWVITVTDAPCPSEPEQGAAPHPLALWLIAVNAGSGEVMNAHYKCHA
jgi:hypothetical protein